MIRYLVLLLFLAAPLRADIAQVSLLTGWRDGARHVAGLKITLDPGWKTYWRAPGDAGIPPQFNWSGSDNVASVRVVWPTPQVFSQNGLRSVGYDSGVVLPVIVTPRDATQPVALRLAMDMGVCQDVCVPVSAKLSGILDPKTRQTDRRITAALADRPLSGGEAGAGAMSCDISAAPRGLNLTASLTLPPMGGDEHAVIELSDPSVYVTGPDVSRQGNGLSLTAQIYPQNGQALGLDRSGLRLTVFGTRGAVEIRGC